MRAPNGWGTIKKLSGKRRKQWAWYMTSGYEIKNGKAVQKQVAIEYFTTRQEGELYRARVMSSGQALKLDSQKVTFEQVYDSLYETKLKDMNDNTRKVYTVSYNKCEPIKKKKMVELDSDDMQDIINAYKDQSVSTQNNLIVLFKAIYSYAMKKDIVVKDYSQFLEITSVKERKKKTPFTREEVQKLWDAEEGWVRDSILILLYTGLRIEELLTLKTEEIHLDEEGKERWVDLHGTKTKSAVRIVPIHRRIIPLIEKRLDGEYLYPARRGGEGNISYYAYRTHFDELLNVLGTKHTPHETRHTFASIAGAKNLNPILVKKILGHSSNDITVDRYTHAYIEDLVAEIDKFEY